MGISAECMTELSLAYQTSRSGGRSLPAAAVPACSPAQGTAICPLLLPRPDHAHAVPHNLCKTRGHTGPLSGSGCPAPAASISVQLGMCKPRALVILASACMICAAGFSAHFTCRRKLAAVITTQIAISRHDVKAHAKDAVLQRGSATRQVRECRLYTARCFDPAAPPPGRSCRSSAAA